MCFMAIDNEVKSLDNDDLLDDEFDAKSSYDELLNDFNDLYMKYVKLALKNSALKKKIFSLTKELEDFLKEKKMKITCDVSSNLKNENVLLKEKFNDLTKIVYKFTNRKKNFDLMLGIQKCVFDKGGIRNKPFSKNQMPRELFC